MDVILPIADHFVLDNVWAKLVPLSSNTTQLSWLHDFKDFLPAVFRPPPPSLLAGIMTNPNQSAWPRDYIVRQILSVFTLTIIGIFALYFIFAAISYYFIFDHRMMRHPRFLKNQVKLEIQCSCWSFPFMTVLTMPWFIGEVRGYSRLYSNVEDYGWGYLIASVPLFLLFTDYCIYWIHRWLHLPFLYKNIHKPHHKWIIPTPFASHAFHPVDGYSQSVPYHLFVFVFPLHRYLYLGLFVAVNFWSIFVRARFFFTIVILDLFCCFLLLFTWPICRLYGSSNSARIVSDAFKQIHDSDMLVSADSRVEKYINTPAHHTLHHIYFTCNYGQYFTWADRSGGSYRPPQADLDPILEVLALDKSGAVDKARDIEAIRRDRKEK